MKRIKSIAVALIMLVSAPAAVAQNLNLGVGLQNMHLWRGLQVADGGVISADVNLGLFKDNFKIGLWGGTDITGRYKEFDYYLSYSIAGFSVSVWDIFNYSPGIYGSDKSYNIFNYNRNSTIHFIDVSLGYNFDVLLNVPLSVNWSTIIQGRDLNSSGTNMYSTYVYAEYSVFRNEKWKVDLGLGGVFGLNRTEADGKSNFYGNDMLNQISLKTSYNLRIKDFTFPLFAHAMWNPDSGNGYLQVGLSFNFKAL